MPAMDVCRWLNRLLILHHRSLAMYLNYAQPYFARNQNTASEILSHIVADQVRIVDRANEMILDLNGVASYGEFPLAFTGYHDLGQEFLWPKLVDEQSRMIQSLERCSAAMAEDVRAKALADEALGAARAHLESLEETFPAGVEVDA